MINSYYELLYCLVKIKRIELETVNSKVYFKREGFFRRSHLTDQFELFTPNNAKRKLSFKQTQWTSLEWSNNDGYERISVNDRREKPPNYIFWYNFVVVLRWEWWKFVNNAKGNTIWGIFARTNKKNSNNITHTSLIIHVSYQTICSGFFVCLVHSRLLTVFIQT